eukprot:366029-Chlamydomonas_euryale.AAC.6
MTERLWTRCCARARSGLPRVEAGAQGPHKLQRGYMPNITYSSHYIADPRLRVRRPCMRRHDLLS